MPHSQKDKFLSHTHIWERIIISVRKGEPCSYLLTCLLWQSANNHQSVNSRQYNICSRLKSLVVLLPVAVFWMCPPTVLSSTVWDHRRHVRDFPKTHVGTTQHFHIWTRAFVLGNHLGDHFWETFLLFLCLSFGLSLTFELALTIPCCLLRFLCTSHFTLILMCNQIYLFLFHSLNTDVLRIF